MLNRLQVAKFVGTEVRENGKTELDATTAAILHVLLDIRELLIKIENRIPADG